MHRDLADAMGTDRRLAGLGELWGNIGNKGHSSVRTPCTTVPQISGGVRFVRATELRGPFHAVGTKT